MCDLNTLSDYGTNLCSILRNSIGEAEIRRRQTAENTECRDRGARQRKRGLKGVAAQRLLRLLLPNGHIKRRDGKLDRVLWSARVYFNAEYSVSTELMELHVDIITTRLKARLRENCAALFYKPTHLLKPYVISRGVYYSHGSMIQLNIHMQN